MELFGTAGIRGDARTNVTPSLALAVGRAAASDGSEFVVGRDGRETGDGIAAAVEAATVRAAPVHATTATIATTVSTTIGTISSVCSWCANNVCDLYHLHE